MGKNNNFVIRTFIQDSFLDAVAWKQLNLQWLQGYDHHSGKIPYLLEELDYVVLNDPVKEMIQIGGQIWFAEMLASHEIVGTIGLLPLDNEWEVNKLAVLPEMQGKGIGRKLIQTVVDYASSIGIKRLVLDSNSHLVTAIHLYESFGFKHIKARGHFVTADVAMEKIF